MSSWFGCISRAEILLSAAAALHFVTVGRPGGVVGEHGGEEMCVGQCGVVGLLSRRADVCVCDSGR